MTPYKNLGGTSGVDSYEIGENSIHVRFKKGSILNYLYDATSPGVATVNVMKRLAEEGRGLGSYISSTVKTNYAKKW